MARHLRRTEVTFTNPSTAQRLIAKTTTALDLQQISTKMNNNLKKTYFELNKMYMEIVEEDLTNTRNLTRKVDLELEGS